MVVPTSIRRSATVASTTASVPPSVTGSDLVRVPVMPSTFARSSGRAPRTRVPTAFYREIRNSWRSGHEFERELDGDAPSVPSRS